MSATESTIADRVLERLAASEAQMAKPRVIAMLPDALARVGESIALSDDYRELQGELDVTVAAGKVDLGVYGVIVDSIAKHGLVILEGTMAKPVPRYESLYAKLPSDIYHYASRGKELHFKNLDGTLGTAAGAAMILANRIPTLGGDPATNIPLRFEGRLVDELFNMAFEKAGKAPPIKIEGV